MHPYLIQSIVEERTREQRELAQSRRDSVVAAGRHQRRAHRTRGIARLLPIRRVLA